MLTLRRDTVIVIGTIAKLKDYVVNPNDTLDSKIKGQINEMFRIYEQKKDVMEEFILTAPHGFDKAYRILKKDKVLKDKLDTDIIVSYEFSQYHELNMLFNPSFEIEDEFWQTIYVSCSKTQLENLRTLYGNGTKLIFKLKYLGDFLTLKSHACRLISYKKYED